ncbi:hypothetical protein BG011_003226 [Mortierella polycephala]|uniref:Uncharacterized protein n=1 Tax=Mortierella polycephala TaxID=41804 RepID=A0A9P6Q392_9FUNG|nr:hypothetical protein BG011_003226 [Mortierella polycephala]
MMYEAESLLTAKLKEEGFLGMCVTKITSESDKRDAAKNTNTLMADLDYFIHTPTISVGTDYNVKGRIDYVSGFFSTQSEVNPSVNPYAYQGMTLCSGSYSRRWMPDALSREYKDVLPKTIQLSLSERKKLVMIEEELHQQIAIAPRLTYEAFVKLREASDMTPSDKHAMSKYLLTDAYDTTAPSVITPEWVKTYDNKQEKRVYKDLRALSTIDGGTMQGRLDAVQQQERLSLGYCVDNGLDI